jgi:hypothetical protein
MIRVFRTRNACPFDGKRSVISALLAFFSRKWQHSLSIAIDVGHYLFAKWRTLAILAAER